ncbi:Zinc finger protein DZIP1 [Varanus komodoensis]|nr:Zinc finger protein DZIP1 [Varanus komodoensis]
MAAAAAAAASSPVPAALPPFQFRPRHESPDWRRLSAVDVERVAAEVDVAALQEHLGHVTFCSAERERCPHCQGPADPLLLRLLRLAQLSLEYLLHSQDYLSAQLRAAQELLRAADAHRDLLAKDVARGAQEIRLLKEECKRRKKMIGTQQMMLQAGATYHQCQFCEKAFMNYSFLHSHLQRRHAEQPHIDQKKKAQTDKLQEEINKLKEQLELTRSQLEAEQHAHIVKLSKEYEEHRSKEEEIRQLFHKWKEEEKEKLASELEKVKEMFMKEFKELTAKNTELETHLLEVQKSNKHLKSNLGTLKDSYEFMEEKHQNTVDHQNIMELLERQETKWTSKVQALQEEHEHEKYQLTSQIEKLKASMTEEFNASNIFYKKRIEELGQRLQEQNDLIIAQKHQIQKLATKKSVESIRSTDAKASSQNVVQHKSSLPSMREQALLVHMLEPIEELPEDEKVIFYSKRDSVFMPLEYIFNRASCHNASTIPSEVTSPASWTSFVPFHSQHQPLRKAFPAVPAVLVLLPSSSSSHLWGRESTAQKAQSSGPAQRVNRQRGSQPAPMELALQPKSSPRSGSLSGPAPRVVPCQLFPTSSYEQLSSPGDGRAG